MVHIEVINYLPEGKRKRLERKIKNKKVRKKEKEKENTKIIINEILHYKITKNKRVN